MQKCSVCKKNVAVIFTVKFIDKKHENVGLCLKCAYNSEMKSATNIFEFAGINDDNIDEITEKINETMADMDFPHPGTFLKALVDGLGGDIDFGKDPLSDVDFSEMSGILESDATGFSEIMNKLFKDENKSTLPVPSTQDDSLVSDEENKQDKSGDSGRKRPGTPKPDFAQKSKRRMLDQFGTNLTDMAKEGQLDRIVGREKELNRVVQILNRRNKNNPVLLGEPGVGKTAIAEGLALRIAENNVPAKLKNLEVYLLDLTAMVAGTQFRGQFEGRMKGVIEDARKAGNVILVIDELHSIMGAGDAEGAMNAGNILKPALAKGDIKVLGSTTLAEYRKYIEKDSALERRFQQVIVDEPSVEESIEILMGVKDYYEEHHGVIYDEEIVRAAVVLSERYINDRFLPDKAIDLLDEAGSRGNLNDITGNNIYESHQRIKALEETLETYNELSIEQPDNESVRKGIALTKTELCKEQDKYEKLTQSHEPVRITLDDICHVIEIWTGIPVARVNEDESAKLLALEDRLKERVIGQDYAIKVLADSIKRRRVGFGPINKPSSFIFVGPTGVGKTQLAKTLAWALFESEDNMIRLDMSEYLESHTVSKMIGSPPGYVGFDEGGQLTEKVRRKPYSVILLDEIEKAHADVYNILLQILDDGRLTDSHGRVVDFSNTVIIMTSNAGTTLKGNTIGFGSDEKPALDDRVNKALKETFRPEFLNRVDETVIFRNLSPENIRDICTLMLKDTFNALEEKGIKFFVSDEVKDFLANKGYDERFGARPLRKVITQHIEDPLTDMQLRGELQGIIGVSAVIKDGEIRFDLL